MYEHFFDTFNLSRGIRSFSVKWNILYFRLPAGDVINEAIKNAS